MRFFEWVRRNSEKYLLEAAQAELALRYLGRPAPVGRRGLKELFWKRLFVPVYRRLPWRLRHAAILGMPGSHRRTWQRPATPRADVEGRRLEQEDAEGPLGRVWEGRSRLPSQ
jgi:hypothetical protein